MNLELAPSPVAPSPTAHLMMHRSMGRPDAHERAELDALVSAERILSAGEVLVHQQREAPSCALLMEGMLARYVVGAEGERQMVALHFAGDFVDLHALFLRRLDHDIVAVNQARVALAPQAPLQRLVAERPALAQKLWYLTLIDAALHRAWLYRVARMDATARVAHFLCECNLRLMAIGDSDGSHFTLDLTQEELGEACGITAIHANRVLKMLRDRGVCTFRRQQVEVHDIAQLLALGEFDPGYLYFDAALLEQFHSLKSQAQ